jgi:hypothetical protein
MILSISVPVILCVSLYYQYVIKSAKGPLDNLTYDEEDDLDLDSIIKVMDLHFKMGKVPHIRKDFNKKRLEYLKKRQMKEYIDCVLKYD